MAQNAALMRHEESFPSGRTELKSGHVLMAENTDPLAFLWYPHGLSHTFPSDLTYGPTSKNRSNVC